MADEAREKLKQIFKQYDASGDGKLTFDDFFGIMSFLVDGYKRADAEVLFQVADQDLSGGVDFEEFVNYIYGDENMVSLFSLEASAREEEAKAALLTKPYKLRSDCVKELKSRGIKWGDLTWKQRLDEVLDLEKCDMEQTGDRKAKAPTKDKSSNIKSKRQKSPSRPATQEAAAAATASASVAPAKSPENLPVEDSDAMGTFSLFAGISPKRARQEGTAVQTTGKRFAIEEKTQEEIVTYSLTSDDLEFANGDPEVKQFREHLKTVGGPEEIVKIIKFIAKGTAGWVFLAEDKQSGQKVAMKLIRMTQAASGVKEWFISKVMTEAGLADKVVSTYPTVCVMGKKSAPPVVKDQLEKAGPCPFYLCLVQELMPWGTVEDLAQNGDLSPEVMFNCLEEVAQTLAKMHQLGVQHKDVKPENIMVKMDGDTVTSAMLCDFGSSDLGDNADGRANDIRRFGVTLFSVATGEGWTQHRLIREPHEKLVARLGDAVADNPDATMRRLPEVLERILSGDLNMQQVADLISELTDAYG